MRLKNYIIVNEIASKYGAGITFIDIDNTLFNSFAKIKVIKNGEVVGTLNNQEYNTYKLKPGEKFDYGEFRDGKFFLKTSTPIPKTIKRLKRMFKNIDRRKSKIILLTARTKLTTGEESFMETFRKNGIPIDDIKIEFSPEGEKSIAGYKKRVILKYISTGEYRRVRLIDDDITNVKTFLKIKDKLPQAIVDKVRTIHNITGPESIDPIEFYGLLVLPNGSLRPI